jgi:hypothetical protein
MDDPNSSQPQTLPAVPADAAASFADPSPERMDGFRRWAMVVFGLIVVLVVIGTLVLVSAGATSRLSALEIAGLWLGVGLLGASALALLVGLDRRRAWAYEATVACCWILVVAAVLRVLIDHTHSTVTIPLEGIAAGLVLSRRPSPLPTMAPEERRVAVAVTVLFLVSEAWPLLTSIGAFGPR